MSDLEVHTGGTGREAEDSSGVIFYFDLGSPFAYISAERISRLFSDAELQQPEWQPILLGGLFAPVRPRILGGDRRP